MVRAHAAEYGVATDHLGMSGILSGGTSDGDGGNEYDGDKLRDASDEIDRQEEPTPDFLVLACIR